ncbi:MAG: hypothetical protein KDA31_14670 [Phycisphaerales bacterium]|nr:hypothetical protein [Phycisphaerales bacterium]MCB9836058.1 hypothetical protein [Phycisphaera sp.]
MARPTKQPHEKRTERHNLRYTPAEMRHIQRQAQLAGLDPTEYMRRLTLRESVGVSSSRTDPALITEVNRLALQLKYVGVTANKLAIATHMEREFRGDWRHVASEIDAVRSEVADTLKRIV